MKKVLQVVFTVQYLSRAILIIMASLLLAWISRHNVYRMLYMLIFGGWGLVFLYYKITTADEEDDI